MDVILYNKLAKLENGTNKLKDETNDTFSDMVSLIEGYNILNQTFTEGKYAYYSMAGTAQLSGVNTLEFDVGKVKKFKYLYTIATPDARGIQFVDKNGTYITGFQTIETIQYITVPNGAVKCVATVDNEKDIVIYDVVSSKPEEILREQATYTSRTSGGVQYTWDDEHSKITISGTRSGPSVTTMYNNRYALPEGMEKGKEYRVVIKSISQKIAFILLPYINGEEGTQRSFLSESYITIPSNWDGLSIRISASPNGTTVNETIDCPEIYTIPENKSMRNEIDEINDAIYGSTINPLAYIRRDAGMLSLFHTVGCIGDSLASGECAYKTNGSTYYVDLYPFSWGQCLARLTGNTYYNFSKGGLTTKTWLSSSYATDCFDGNHNCDMYFIGLGQNDKNTGMEVGTTADINLEDYTQNADTYCGNYGKIIQKLQELQPKAPIFVFTDPNPPSNDQAYNNAIIDIVDLFENVWVIDLKTYAVNMFKNPTEIIGSQARSGHYSALGYQQIAFVIATYVDWIIRNNLSDFSQIEFIGTDYEWSTT